MNIKGTLRQRINAFNQAELYKMKLHTAAPTLCVCISALLVLAVAGFEFQLHENPPFSRKLECSVDANISSQDIFTIIDLTIFDVTNNKTAKKVAAISVLDTDLYVDHVSKRFLAVEGSVSQYYADLVVTFSNQTYCLLCSYMCELNFINPDGHPVVRHSTVQSPPAGSDISYSIDVSVDVANQMIAAVDRLASITHDVEDRLSERLAQLEEKLDNITLLEEKLDNMAVLEGKLDNIVKLEGKLDNIAKFEGKLDTIAKLEGKLDTIAKLEGKLDNMAVLEEKLDNITALLTPASVENKGLELTTRTSLTEECKEGMANVTREPRILVKILDDKPALCDTKTEGGGWIIFQRRTDGRENFYRPWTDYVSGFGDIEGGGDYWLGLQYIHELVSQGTFELRVEMESGGKSYYAQYNSFYLGNVFSMYQLSLGDYTGNSTDSLDHHRNRKFSTYDKNNDDSSTNCAVAHRGAWWYGSCESSNLNGKWGSNRWIGVGYNLPMTEMKVRLMQ